MPSLEGPGLFNLLNHRADLDAHGWDDPALDKLWRYNQHYFDDLNAEGADARASWHAGLIARWIAENPPGKGTGWEPYPVSLRIVNWIKSAQVRPLPAGAVASLAIQARWLAKRIEWHLLGNHLFANAKALVFAGAYFEGAEANAWRKAGLAILEAQLPEQILPDGGQFELSPMYHALALEDLLDLCNLAARFPAAFPACGGQTAAWRETVPRMRLWLDAMSHPDGGIAFFNDAAFGVAPANAELNRYAAALGLSGGEAAAALTVLPDSGYVRLASSRAVAIVDVGKIGPDYLPGHAHADSLSFEMSLEGGRVIVNGGTSCYGVSAERARQRGTGAHSTVQAGSFDSSEVWSGFRVARGAKPGVVEARDLGEDRLEVIAEHDGYARMARAGVHRRTVRLENGGISIADTLPAMPAEAVARYILHPSVRAEFDPDAGEAQLIRGEKSIALWRCVRGRALIEPATYHPEFGLSLPTSALCAVLENGESAVHIRWLSVDSAPGGINPPRARAPGRPGEIE
jgi:uncharacterized heparinase superfamily protein